MKAHSVIPLIVGVTGHRDLVESEVPALRQRVRDFFEKLRLLVPNTPIVVASQLAEGADLLVAEEADALGLELVCLLPMPLQTYRAEFTTAASLERFDALYARSRVIRVPAGCGETGEALDERDRQYAAAGRLLARHCYILLALWDGKPMTAPGGTAAVVAYRMATGDRPRRRTETPNSLLAQHDNTLTYHIVASRVRDHGDEHPVHRALSAGYLHGVAGGPSVLEPVMPQQHRRVLARTDEFNADARRHCPPQGEPSGASVGRPAGAPESVQRCARLVNAADLLARHFRQNMQRAVALTYFSGAVLGAAFVVYSKAPAQFWYLIYVFLGFALLGIGTSHFAERRHWHRKHLEYRALAEGLRVQFYWRLAGVQDEGRLHTGDESFLRYQDADLEWIRNGLRAADLELLEIAPDGLPGGIGLAIERWVGVLDTEAARGGGQLAYYWRTVTRKRRVVHGAELVGRATLVAGLCAALVLCFSPLIGLARMQLPLVIMMGLLPLASGILEAYVQKSADRELARQYAYMYRLFDEARARLRNAESEDEQRAVLHALGRAALAEHATWVLLNRDRKLRHLDGH